MTSSRRPKKNNLFDRFEELRGKFFEVHVKFFEVRVKFAGTSIFQVSRPGTLSARPEPLSFCHPVIARFGVNFGPICTGFRHTRHHGRVLRSAIGSIAVKTLQLTLFSEHRAGMTERAPSVIGLSSTFWLSLGRVLQRSTP